MGADIYLNSIGKYFRNSYNDEDVMRAMGLSWWGTVLPMLYDVEQRTWLPVQRARELLALIEARPLTDEGLALHYSAHITSGLNEHPITGPIESILAASLPELNDGNAGPSLPPDFFVPPDFESWARSLRECREDLIAILRKSIELNKELDCSL
jgi:hypothetical protein